MANNTPWTPKGNLTPERRPTEGYDREDPREFARSVTRHPQGGNVMNKDIQERRETEKKPTEAPERTRDPVESDTKDKFAASNLAMQAEELRGELGQVADEIMGYADSFLKSGEAQIGGLDSTGGVEFDPETGSYEIVGGFEQADFGQMAERKFNELQKMRQAADTFFVQDEETGEWQPRNFRDVVAEHYNALDADAKMQVDAEVNKLISLAEKINRLEQLGEGESAEANALRRQLELEDKNGLVSGLYQAKERVEGLLSGETSFYGDEGDEGYSVADLLNLSRSDIEEELKKAAASSSGLFGGDFEAAIARTLDHESEEYQNFLQEERGFRNTLGRAGRNYFTEMKRRFTQAAGKIKQALDDVAPQIMEEMGDSIDAELAQEWFTALSSGDADDFASVMTELIYDPDSGIDVADRRTLAKYVGDVLKSEGIDLGIDEDSALLTDAIRELEETGQITWVDENGVSTTVTPTGIDKERILIAMGKGEDALKQEFKELVNNQGIRLDKTLSQITDGGSYGSLERATEGFRDAIVGSLDTFKGSESEEALAYAASGGNPEAFNQMSDAEKSQYMLDYLQANPQITEEIIKSKVTDAQSTFEQQKKTLESQFETLGAAYNQGLEKVRDTLERLGEAQGDTSESFNAYKQEISQGIEDLAEKQYRQLSGTQRVYDMLQDGTLTENELKSTSHLVSQMEYLRLLQQQGNDVYSAVERKLTPDQRNYLKEYVSPDYRDASIGNQLSYRNSIVNGMLSSAAKNDGRIDAFNRVLSSAIGSLSMNDVPSVANYIDQIQKDSQMTREAGRKYQKGLSQIENKRNVLGELEGRFKETLEGMINPETIGRAAQTIARQLEEQGASSMQAVDLGGTGQRQDIVENVDPLQQVRADIPTPDYNYQMQAVEGDLNTVDVGEAYTDTGMEQYSAPSVEEVMSGESHVRDKRIMENERGQRVIGDLVTGRVFDEEGNPIEGYYIDPMSGRLVDPEGNETGDFFRTTFDSNWMEDPGISQELQNLSPSQRVAVNQAMEQAARENVASAEEGATPGELDRDVIASGADMARFLRNTGIQSEDTEFLKKSKIVYDTVGGNLPGAEIIDLTNFVSDQFAKKGTSLEDEAARLASVRNQGEQPTREQIQEAYSEIIQNNLVVKYIKAGEEARNMRQDRTWKAITSKLNSFGLEPDEAELLAATALNPDGTLNEDAYYQLVIDLKEPEPTTTSQPSRDRLQDNFRDSKPQSIRDTGRKTVEGESIYRAGDQVLF